MTKKTNRNSDSFVVQGRVFDTNTNRRIGDLLVTAYGPKIDIGIPISADEHHGEQEQKRGRVKDGKSQPNTESCNMP